MAKQNKIKKIFNQNVIIILLFVVVLIGLYIGNALIESEMLIVNRPLSIEFFFYIAILSSCLYSTQVVENDLKYNVMFGTTRKETYKFYLRNVFIILLLTILLTFFVFFCTWMYKENKKIDIINEIFNMKLIELISCYIFLSMFFFFLATLNVFKKVHIYLIIVISLFVFLFHRYFNMYISLGLLLVGLILLIINYRRIILIKLNILN